MGGGGRILLGGVREEGQGIEILLGSLVVKGQWLCHVTRR